MSILFAYPNALISVIKTELPALSDQAIANAIDYCELYFYVNWGRMSARQIKMHIEEAISDLKKENAVEFHPNMN